MGKKGQPGTHFNGKYQQGMNNGKLQVKSKVGVSGFMDILTSNTYSARPLSLSMGKKGQPGTHFNGKYQQGMNNGKLQVKLKVGVSGYMDILILNTHPARPLSLSMGKKGQPGTHFNRKYQQRMNLIFQQEITCLQVLNWR